MKAVYRDGLPFFFQSLTIGLSLLVSDLPTRPFRGSASWRISGRLEGMSMYAVYAIYNQEKGKVYIGQTKNLEERLQSHNSGRFQGYTSRFVGQWIVIYSEEISTRQEALRREK